MPLSADNQQRGEPQTETTARVAVDCVVCGAAPNDMICSAPQIAAQLAYLCGFHRRRLRPSTDGKALADRAEFNQGEAAPIARCGGCGHIFRATRPPAAAVTGDYADDAYGADRLQSLFAAQRAFFRGKLDALAATIASDAAPAVVEVGSFVGGFLAAAGERGWSAVGIDPGEEVARFCRARGLPVHCTTAPQAPIAPDSADCVAIWNTFDQLPDPRPTLRAARRWLRRDGVLVLRVPNGPAFAAAMRALPRLPTALRPLANAALAWNNLLGFPYLQGYGLATLDRLLEEFGLLRVAQSAQTLVPLADRHTRRWAVWEERLLKAAWRLAIRRAPDHAPWLDVYYRAVD
jgi:SAM-dependent methyltransferase